MGTVSRFREIACFCHSTRFRVPTLAATRIREVRVREGMRGVAPRRLLCFEHAPRRSRRAG